MPAAPSIATIATVAAARIAARAGISPNVASASDLAGESGNRGAGGRPARRWAGYRLAEISVDEQDHDQEEYGKSQHGKACHGAAPIDGIMGLYFSIMASIRP